MTTSTVVTITDPKLKELADKALRAARDYWDAYQAAFGGRAVVYLTDTSGAMIVFTRGEYRHTLFANIERVELDVVRNFGGDEVEPG